MISRTPAPTAEMIRAQGFQIILGQAECLRGPDGRTYRPHFRVMVGCTYYPAAEIRNVLAESIEQQLEADIQDDKQARRRELKAAMADKGRQPTRRPPRRRGKQRRDGSDDPLGLKGREFTTPVK